MNTEKLCPCGRELCPGHDDETCEYGWYPTDATHPCHLHGKGESHHAGDGSRCECKANTLDQCHACNGPLCEHGVCEDQDCAGGECLECAEPGEDAPILYHSRGKVITWPANEAELLPCP